MPQRRHFQIFLGMERHHMGAEQGAEVEQQPNQLQGQGKDAPVYQSMGIQWRSCKNGHQFTRRKIDTEERPQDKNRTDAR